MVKKIRNSQGLSLIEVSIAIFLFSLFAVAFVSGQARNVLFSVDMKRELTLKDLAELKLNELILDPPNFQESLTSTVQNVKAFKDFPEYQYSLEMKKFTLPDMSSFEEETVRQDLKQLRQRVYATVRDNMEKMVWQYVLVVTHKETGQSFTVSFWPYNSKDKVVLSGF